MTADLTGVTVALLATDGVEQVELTDPWDALKAAGAIVHLVSPVADVQAFHHLEEGDVFPADRKVADVNPDTYDALVLPGGVANPDALRTDQQSVDLVASFFAERKPVAAICHAPWTLVEAGVLQGRRVTSWPSLQTDLRNAGAEWVDEEVVICDHLPDASVLVTSRKPDDLPAFVEATIDAFAPKANTA